MSSSPLVSIAIAAYNRAHLIGRTLDSFLQQTVRDFEIVITDDSTFDETGEVCQRYAAIDARVRYFRNERRLGLGGNCSRVLSMCRGEFVVLAGDDADIYAPDFLERLLAVMRRWPSVSLAACRVDIIDQDDRVIREMGHEHFASAPLSSTFRNANRMLWRAYGSLMTGMYRRDMMMRTLLYRPVIDDDWDEIDLLFLFDMALQGDVVTIPDLLLHKRVGGISSDIPHRTIFRGLRVYGAAARGYVERIRRSTLPPWQRTLLYSSLAFRWAFGAWQWKKYLAYTVLVTIDPKRHARRHLRRFWQKQQEKRQLRHAAGRGR
jgi:glycosyltransferase involved in cell wall biosynthesis